MIDVPELWEEDKEDIDKVLDCCLEDDMVRAEVCYWYVSIGMRHKRYHQNESFFNFLTKDHPLVVLAESMEDERYYNARIAFCFCVGRLDLHGKDEENE